MVGLKRTEITCKYIEVIEEMYNGVITPVKQLDKIQVHSKITIGVHKVSTLISYLFALVMNELTRHHQDEFP